MPQEREMVTACCMVIRRDLFFDLEETVVQLHPKKSKYRNFHNGCLHLWRNQKVEYDLPPQIMI